MCKHTRWMTPGNRCLDCGAILRVTIVKVRGIKCVVVEEVK